MSEVKTNCEECKWRNSCGRFKQLAEAQTLGEDVEFNCADFEEEK